MQAFTPHSPLSAQAGTGEGEQAGLEFWDGNQKWCHSEGRGVRGDEKGQLGFIPLPDSMAAGEGAARSWGRAEAAERGGGAFSQSPGR